MKLKPLKISFGHFPFEAYKPDPALSCIHETRANNQIKGCNRRNDNPDGTYKIRGRKTGRKWSYEK